MPHVAPTLLHLADWELLQMSPLPVLHVKSSRPYHDPIVRAAIDPTHAFSSLTRLDGEILRNSAAIQRALRGTLHTVHAYLPLPLKMRTGAAAHAKKGFERALWTTHIPRARCHLSEKSAPQAIPDVAPQTGSAIVLMGAVSPSGMSAFIANTAERALQRSGQAERVQESPAARQSWRPLDCHGGLNGVSGFFAQ
jgi:universal stress protein E